MRNEFSFTGVSRVTMSHETGTTKSTHVATDIFLELSKNLEREKYLKDDLPTKDGIKPLSQCFIQGLVANIHKAHQEGWWDSAEHLRYVIEELKRGFVEVANVSDGIF